MEKLQADEDTFEDFNGKDEADEHFDDFFNLRRDFGKLITTICKCCSGADIYNNFFKPKFV